MDATWTVLGAGSILPRAGYGCSGYALRTRPGGELTLFDCGPGSLRSMGEAGLDLQDIVRVVLSHYHPDHCLDLFALLFARRNPALRDLPPLEIIGPKGLDRILSGGRAAFGRWIEDDEARVTVVDPTGPRRAIERSEMELRWEPTGHTPNAVAWRADLEAGSVTYTGDTGENDQVAGLASKTDLFVCECSFPDAEGTPHHLTPSSAARMARRAECHLLLLTHFYPSLDPDHARKAAAAVFDGAIEVARDRSVHPICRGSGSSPRDRH